MRVDTSFGGQLRPTSHRAVSYFAYGSNMCHDRLTERVPTARFELIARLPEHTLRFHKRSIDGSGKADAYFTGDPEDEVWGTVAHIPDEDRSGLDRAEGAGHGYEIEEIVVYGPDGAPQAVFTYVAQASYIEPDLKPYDWYLALVVDGARARALPQDYIERIASIDAVVDPEPFRKSRPPESRFC